MKWTTTNFAIDNLHMKNACLLPSKMTSFATRCKVLEHALLNSTSKCNRKSVITKRKPKNLNAWRLTCLENCNKLNKTKKLLSADSSQLWLTLAFQRKCAKWQELQPLRVICHLLEVLVAGNQVNQANAD